MVRWGAIALSVAFLITSFGTPSWSFTLPNVPTLRPKKPSPPPPSPPPPAPGFEVFSDEPAKAAAAEPTKQESTSAAPGCPWDLRQCVVNKLAVNLDYRFSSQKIRPRLQNDEGTPLPANNIDLNSTALRVEYVALQFLSVYALAVRHDGYSKSSVDRLSLDGWGGGVGASAMFAIPETFEGTSTDLLITPIALADFTYTYNDFQDISSGVEAYNTTERVGLFIRHDKLDDLAVTLVGGASYSAQDERQVVRSAGTSVPIAISPDDSWVPIVGVLFSQIHRCDDRPRWSLAIEGGWGQREQVVASLRYEWH